MTGLYQLRELSSCSVSGNCFSDIFLLLDNRTSLSVKFTQFYPRGTKTTVIEMCDEMYELSSILYSGHVYIIFEGSTRY